MKKEFIEILEKYFSNFNTLDIREKMRTEIENLFDRRFLGKVVDKTTHNDMKNGEFPNIVIEMLGHEFTLEEYSQFINLYEN